MSYIKVEMEMLMNREKKKVWSNRRVTCVTVLPPYEIAPDNDACTFSRTNYWSSPGQLDWIRVIHEKKWGRDWK
jgi:hypothetical protein